VESQSLTSSGSRGNGMDAATLNNLCVTPMDVKFAHVLRKIALPQKISKNIQVISVVNC
jgi:hypothetical protein